MIKKRGFGNLSNFRLSNSCFSDEHNSPSNEFFEITLGGSRTRRVRGGEAPHSVVGEIEDTKISETKECFNSVDNSVFLKTSDTQCQLDNYFDDLELYLVNKVCKNYEEKYHKVLKQMYFCLKKMLLSSCKECDNTDIIQFPYLCHNKFCVHEICIEFRIAKAYEKLQNLGIKGKKCIHFILGSNERNKNQLFKVKNKLRKKLSNKFKLKLDNGNYDIIDVGAFDKGKTNFKKYGKYYNHLHIGYFGITNSVIQNQRDFIFECRKIVKEIDDKVVFHFIGVRSKKNFFRYISKRIAGVYGDTNKGVFYIKDIMSKKEYLDEYFNKKVLFYHFAEGIVYRSIFISRSVCCEKCHAPVRYDGFYLKCDDGLDPPGISKFLKKNLENLLVKKIITTIHRRKLKVGFDVLSKRIRTEMVRGFKN